jgi:hypothetical protein
VGGGFGDADVNDGMQGGARFDRGAAAFAIPCPDETSHTPRATHDTCRSPRSAPRQNRVPTECGDLPFLIKRDGTWLYRGTPIGRKELVCLFASVLKRDAEGAFWLQTPVERGRIDVEDAPFLAVEMDWCGCGRDQVLTFRTNVDQMVTADAEHPIRVAHDILTCEPTPYLKVRDGEGHLAVEARISRACYYELVAIAEPEIVGGRRMLGVWSCRRFFPLGELPQCEE